METEENTGKAPPEATDSIPAPAQTDGCYDDNVTSGDDSECDYEVEQIFNLTMQRIHRDQAEGMKTGDLSWMICHSDDDVSSPWLLPQVDGAGDEEKPSQQNTGVYCMERRWGRKFERSLGY